MAGLGQDEATTAASEKFLPERFFENAELRADGRLRHMEFLRRFSHAALSRHHPEVAEVMIIQPFHPENDT